MRIIGCDLHARQQTIAMLDDETGDIVERTLKHEGNTIRDFYAALPQPVVVGIEATGSMGWFLALLEDLSIPCRVGHPAKIRRAEVRRQKHDRRDAALLLELLRENRFPSIWIPSMEFRDLRALLLHRDQWVRIRTRVQNALQGIALANGLRRGPALWRRAGQAVLTALPLQPHAADRRSELQALLAHLNHQIQQVHARVETEARRRPVASRLMTHPGVGPVTALATEVFLGDPARFADAKAVASYVEAYRLCRRAHSEGGWGPWDDRASIPRSCENERCVWCSTTRRSTRPSGRRFGRSRKRSGARWRCSVAGSVRRSVMQASGLA
jgi:transposase